jgi:hypothetical protein
MLSIARDIARHRPLAALLQEVIPPALELLGRKKRARGEWDVRDIYCVYIYIWVNYNDLTATSLESWLVRGIIP